MNLKLEGLEYESMPGELYYDHIIPESDEEYYEKLLVIVLRDSELLKENNIKHSIKKSGDYPWILIEDI